MILNKIKSAISIKLTYKLEKFSDLHKGESCYIFGSGPSIKWFDLTCFKNLPCICCGMLPFHKDFNKLDVRYCSLIEPWLFVPSLLQPDLKSLSEYKVIAEAYKTIIKTNPDKEFFVHLSNCFSLKGKNINYVFRGLPKIRNRTDALLSQFNLFSGSFHASLALAYHLGFSKVFLLGFDAWTIQPSRNLHWYELGKGVFFEPATLAAEFLEILKSKVDINTITISDDDFSRNVTAISYKTYTGKSPEFKENYELLDKRYLNILASYPGYKIYAK